MAISATFETASFPRRSSRSLPAFLLCGRLQASTTEIIYSFAGEEDGEYTDTDVAIDAAGIFMGPQSWAASLAVARSGNCLRLAGLGAHGSL